MLAAFMDVILKVTTFPVLDFQCIVPDVKHYRIAVQSYNEIIPGNQSFCSFPSFFLQIGSFGHIQTSKQNGWIVGRRLSDPVYDLHTLYTNVSIDITRIKPHYPTPAPKAGNRGELAKKI